MQKVFNVAVDIGRKLPAPAFDVNTNDLKSVKLLITITNGQTLLDLTDTTVRIAIRKPDNNILFQDCTINDAKAGQVEIILENQAYIMAGTHTAEIMCYKGNEVVAVSGTFSYKSTKGIMNDEAVESKSEFTSISNMMKDVQDTIDDIRKNGTGVDAKARQDIQSVTTQLADTEPLYAATKTKEEVDIFLVYGQSNAMGYAGKTVGDPKFKTPNVSVWDGKAEIPLTNFMPTSQGETSTGGAWVAFANEYARKTGRKGIIANCAKSSQSIADLSKGASNTLYSNLVKWGNDIKSYITNSGKTVGKIAVLWCQGETDIVAQTSRASYETAISTLWANIKTDIGAESFNIFTVGFYNDDTKKYGWQIQNAQRNFSKANTDVYIIFDSIDSLAGNNMKVDGVHLNQRGYNLMGEVGAKNYCESALLKSSNESLPLISRNGTINLDGTQEWQLFGGWIRKVNGAWAVSSQSARAITGIQSATESNGSLHVTLSNKIDYILFEEAKLNYGLPEASNNQVIQAKIIPLTYQTTDTSGNTNVVIHFYSDVVLTIDLEAKTFNTSLMGIDLSGLFTASFGVGGVTLTHQNVKTGVAATVYNADNTPRFISVNPISTTQTNIRVFDTTGVLSNSRITCILKDMKIPVDKIPSGDANAQNPELMLSVIGAKRQSS